MKNSTSVVLALVGLTSLSVALPMSIARAQQSVPAQAQAQPPLGGPATQAQQGGFGGGIGQAPPMMGRVMTGGTPVMIQDEQNLYVLQGNRVFKMSKAEMRVVREGNLPMGPPLAERTEDQKVK